MNDTKAVDQPDGKSDTTRGVVRWLLQIGVFTLILMASLFISSGRLDWVMAWIYVGLFVASQALTAFILIPSNPELLAKRAESKGPRDLDRVLAGLVALFGPVSIWVVAGLDMRFGWRPQIPLALQLVALAIAALGSLLTIWAMASNKFFYGVAHIADDHAVATVGPYRYVRHPGYAGGILFDLATPLALGSWWTFIPALLTVCFIVARAILEDRTLQEELDGYEEYAQRTRYRLLPGIW